MISRRAWLRSTAAIAAALPFARALGQNSERMSTRRIPSTKEALPVMGLGTYRVLDVAPDSAEYRELPGVLDALFDAGGRVIDSSPMYGRAEQTAGGLLAARHLRDKADRKSVV